MLSCSRSRTASHPVEHLGRNLRLRGLSQLQVIHRVRAMHSPRPHRLESRRSAANSRIVSSIVNRGSSTPGSEEASTRDTTRLLSTSDARISRTLLSSGIPGPQTASAASRVKPPAKTASRPNSARSSGLEEIVAPRDRVAQCLLPLRQVARPAREQGQPEIQPVEQRLRREQLDPGRRQLDRQRQPVEPLADLRHRGLVRRRSSKPGETSTRVPEEPHRRRALQGAPEQGKAETGELPLAAEPERSPARGEHRQARTPPTRSATNGHGRSRCSKLSSSSSSLLALPDAG